MAEKRQKTGGRQKGTPNKTTALLKDAILQAADSAGGTATDKSPGGLVGYLTKQAADNPGPFMTLLGKVLPTQLTGANGEPMKHLHTIEDGQSARDIVERRIAALAARRLPVDDVPERAKLN